MVHNVIASTEPSYILVAKNGKIHSKKKHQTGQVKKLQFSTNVKEQEN